MPPSAPIATGNFPSAVVYFMADNQERELFGDPTYYSARLAQETSDVAVRSVEQDLYTKYVAESVMRHIAQQDGAPPIIHLGDLLDYSCNSEFRRLQRFAFLSAPNVYIARGNHDGIFQGNMSYGGWVGAAWLYIRKILVNRSIDPSLEGHFNAVCGQLDPIPNAEDEADKRPFPDAREWAHQFNCDYLRLKSAGPLPPAIATYCDASDYHRRVLVIKGKETPPLIKAQLVVQKPYEYVASMSTWNSLNKWNSGHLVQALKVPLRQKGVETRADLGIILLDTTDWPSVPSFKFLSDTSNSNLGTIREGQRTRVIDQLKAWRGTSVKAVVLSGHYPLRSLDRSSARWMLSLRKDFPFVAPVYFSAHTHEGYTAVGDDLGYSDGTIHEINVGSLIDAPVHYRKATFQWDAEKSSLLLNSELRVPWNELRCDLFGSPKAEAANVGGHSALSFKNETRFQPQRQWCKRLTYAGRSLRQLGKQPLVEIDYNQCTASELRPTPVFLTNYRAAQASLDASVAGNIPEQERLACAALAGGEVFAFHRTHIPPGTINYAFDLNGATVR